jgi:hypothetical protein
VVKIAKYALLASGLPQTQDTGLVRTSFAVTFDNDLRKWSIFAMTTYVRNDLAKHLGGMQGCQMVCFQTKNPNLGKFWGAVECKMLAYFMVIWNILRSFGIFCGHLVVLW